MLLSSDSGHDGWANSKALEMAELTRQPGSRGWRDGRDAVGGEPRNGLLLGMLISWLNQLVPDWSLAQ